MDEASFEGLLQQGEGEQLAFASSLPSPSELALLISAFCNTRGGTLILGVDSEGQLVGIDGASGVRHKILSTIRTKLRLEGEPKVDIVLYQDKEFVVVECEEGRARPYFVHGKYWPYVRVGSTNVRQPWPETVVQLFSSRWQASGLYGFPGFLFFADVIFRAALDVDLTDAGADMALLAVSFWIALFVDRARKRFEDLSPVLFFFLMFFVLWLVSLGLVSGVSSLPGEPPSWQAFFAWFFGASVLYVSSSLSNIVRRP